MHTAMKTEVRIVSADEQTDEDRRLAKAAADASQRAIAEAFAAGLSITVVRGNRIVRVAPDGTETFVQNLPSSTCPPASDSV